MLNNLILDKYIKVFFISFFLVFLMVFIPHLNFISHKLVSPQSVKVSIWDKLEPMLEKKQAGYELKKGLIPTVSASSDYEQAQAYIVTDFDSGEVITSKNLSQKLPMASLTKVMTAVVALDLAKMDDEFIVSQKASNEIPTKVMLKEGERYTLEHLLNASLISSANDATQVIKEGIDAKYGEKVFIEAMNQKAKFLGLINTHFTNPQGFDNSNHYSTVEDLAILSHYAIQNYPEISSMVASDTKDLTKNGQDMRFYLQNWNGLMGVYPGVTGIKIGNTDNAQVCTIVLSQREGKKILAVVLGAPGVTERDLWAGELLDVGFSKYGISPVNVTREQLKEKYASWKYFE